MTVEPLIADAHDARYSPDMTVGPVLLVGTRKGFWTVRADAERRSWTTAGPMFLGHVVNHVVLDHRDRRTLLAASSTGLTGATSSTFNVTAGAPNKLAFSVQPSNTASGASISPAVKVEVRVEDGDEPAEVALA